MKRIHPLIALALVCTSWLFDASAGRTLTVEAPDALIWQAGPVLPNGVADGALFALGNTLFYGGGWAGIATQPFRDFYAAPLVNGVPLAWRHADDLPASGRFGMAHAASDRRGYLLGGYTGSGITDRVDSFDGTVWQSENNLPEPLNFPAAAIIANRL